MSLEYAELDAWTRELMLEEIDLDAANACLYISSRLTEEGEQAWGGLLRDAARVGSDKTLAVELGRRGYLHSHETRNKRSGPTPARVPHTAANTLAEGEFNRFYCRALCRRVMASEGDDGLVVVVRAKVVKNPRPESELKVGMSFNAKQLLADLRTHQGVDTALGVPAGPNSGLSIALHSA